MKSSDFLSLLTHAGVPSHELYLKLGAVYTIMRNMSLEKGLIKNARLVIHAHHQRFVEVRPLDHNGSLSPTAFPSHGSYSASIPSSSWTVDRFRMCLYVPQYSAVSRIRTRHEGLVLFHNDHTDNTTYNIGHKTLLL